MSLFEITQIASYEKIKSQVLSIPELEIWKLPPDGFATHVRQLGENFWLDCSDFGAIHIDCLSKKISAYPKPGLNPDKFIIFLSHEWLPMAYQICGTQVLHASAVANKNSGKVIAFCGDSGAGKSTFGYGFAKKQDWLQIADDHLAFSVEERKLKPVYIQDYVHLRPKSALFFNQQVYRYEPCMWRDSGINFDSVIFLSPNFDNPPQFEKPFKITPIKKADTYKLLLKQAFALTTKLPKKNQKILDDYLVLANQLKAYRLNYTLSFENLNEIFDGIESEIY